MEGVIHEGTSRMEGSHRWRGVTPERSLQKGGTLREELCIESIYPLTERSNTWKGYSRRGVTYGEDLHMKGRYAWRGVAHGDGLRSRGVTFL